MTEPATAESPPAAGRILGNLDCEADFAACLGARRPALTRAALETASDLATLLRAFARDGDSLWTPMPVARSRLPEIPGLPRPELESGPLSSLPPPREVLAWGETPAAGLHRRRRRAGAAASPRQDAPLDESLWRLPVPDPAVAAAVHHRAFALEVGSRLGATLPGSRMVVSPSDLDRHLRSWDPGAGGNTGRWVLKAPLSAAGRWRHHGRGRPAGDDARSIERLFARHGALVFEPWLERTEDFGLAGLLDARGARIVGFHRSLIDRRGAFLGLELEAGFSGLRGLDDRERDRLEEVFEGVAGALRQAGYRGPFGIDCWRYRRSAGPGDAGLGWQPLGEINARMTFGLVARALVDRIRGPLGLEARATVTLRLGARPRTDRAPALTLLTPSPPGRTAAWLEISTGSLPEDDLQEREIDLRRHDESDKNSSCETQRHDTRPP